MTRAKRYFARLLAVLALIAVAIAIVVIVSNANLNSKESNGNKKSGTHAKKHKKHRTKAKTYTIKSGDTLTSIAHKTGIPISEIQALNPEVDPQILTAGETLKLK
jgi:LysM repeat protein